MAVEGEILAEMMFMKDIVQEFAISISKPDGMVGHVLIPACCSEVENEEAHGTLRELELHSWSKCGFANHLRVKKRCVCIGNHNLRPKVFTI